MATRKKKPAPKKAAPKGVKNAAKKAAPKKAAKKVAKKSAKKSAPGKAVKRPAAKPARSPKKPVEFKILNVVPPLPKPDASLTRLREDQSAPTFKLPADTGGSISLGDFRGQYVVLYFYPKDDTPGCTQEACDLRDSYSNLQGLRAVVLGVSKDSVESHKKFKAKFGLPFPLLADVEGKICEAYDVWKEKSMYGKKYMGIERTTFVIAPDGRIKKIFPKVKVQGHVAEIMAAIAE